MSHSYRIDIDKSQVADAISAFEFVGGNTKDALRIAINKTGPKIRTQASRLMRQQIRFTAGYVAERLLFKRAKTSSLTGYIRAPKYENMLSRFDTNPTVASEKVNWIRPPLVPKTGIKIKIKPNGPSHNMGKDAFYMVLNGGKNVAIAERMTSARKPVQVFYGVSVSQAFSNIRTAVLPDAANEFQAQLIDAMRYILVKQHPPEPVL